MDPRKPFRRWLVGVAIGMAIVGTCEGSQAPDLSALHEIQRRAAERLAIGDVLGALTLTRGEDQPGRLTGLAESWNRQHVIELLSAIGRHRESLALLRESGLTERDPKAPTEAEMAVSRRMPLRPAVDRLLGVAKERQVLMINEEHWRPEHRAFAAGLLPRLRQLGFRYLALETPDQPALDEAMRTGRVTVQTDDYCYDPQRANLLRSAIRSGMKIIAFDVTSQDLAELRNDPLAAMARREDWMARNIQQRILDHDPAAKIVVWVGMGHISKKPLDIQGKPVEFMALRFFKRTGIDPYCVNQTSDTGADDTDRRVYRLLMKTRKAPSIPVLFEPPSEVAGTYREQASALFSLLDGAGLDALILHPLHPTESGRKRPQWQTRLQTLSLDGRLTGLLAEFDPAARYLVQALDLADGPDAAATDQVTPTPEGRFTLAVFPKHSYRLRVWKAPAGAVEARIVLERRLP